MNFQDTFNPTGSRADYVSGDIWQQLLPSQHFEYFWVLKFVGIPQPKPMHCYSPNFQEILTERGFTAD